MEIKTLVVGQLETNSYLAIAADGGGGLVIDPGGDPARLLEAIRAAGAPIEYVINTHAHVDHTSANSEILEATGAKLAIHELDARSLEDPYGSLRAFMPGDASVHAAPSWLLADGDRIPLGAETLTVVHTPGHTPGGISLVSPAIAFTGDTLFHRGVGRTDLPGGDWEALQRSIRERLFVLPDDTIVYPGHGPSTTIEEEKRLNPYVRPE